MGFLLRLGVSMFLKKFYELKNKLRLSRFESVSGEVFNDYCMCHNSTML